MKRRMATLLAAGLLSVLSVHSFAQQATDFTTSDVLGMFANQGANGANAGTLTVTEAHQTCIAEEAGGHENSNGTYQTDHHDTYRSCMASFVPFRVAGAGEAGTCSSTTVSWGQCSATVPSMPDGSSYSARNTYDTENFEGFASFQCSGGQLSYVSGGCSRAVNQCESDQVVEWGVTTPEWADEDASTVFVDRFGVERHTPKGRCYAIMPGSLSGALLRPNPTVPEMIEPDRYNMLSSSSPQRCFDGDWLNDSSMGAETCEYIPKTCSAMTYTHPDGCQYNIPSGEHDEVFVSNNPLPQNSVGGVQAHCWDGEWEIKASSCQMSCSPSVDAHTWSSGVSGVNRQCTHPTIGYSERLAPSTNLLIENVTAGMNGNSSYTCVNGTLVRNSEFCEPQGCGSVPARSWEQGGNSCSHNSVVGNYTHGQTFVINTGDPFSTTLGQSEYLCEYGEYQTLSDTCGSNQTGEPICYAEEVVGGTTPTPPPGDFNVCGSHGAFYENGLCCRFLRNKTSKRCYQIP